MLLMQERMYHTEHRLFIVTNVTSPEGFMELAQRHHKVFGDQVAILNTKCRNKIAIDEKNSQFSLLSMKANFSQMALMDEAECLKEQSFADRLGDSTADDVLYFARRMKIMKEKLLAVK